MLYTECAKCCILYIYSTNTGAEYFKRGIYCPFYFPLQNAVCFIILTYLVPVLFTFYIQDVLNVAFYIFIQQIQVLNILNTVYTVRIFPLQNAVCFIILTYLIPVLFTFYIQSVLNVAFYIFIQQIQVLNILNKVYTVRFFLFKMQFVS